MLPIRNISYLLPMCCSFWEKCKNGPKTGLGCSTPLRGQEKNPFGGSWFIKGVKIWSWPKRLKSLKKKKKKKKLYQGILETMNHMPCIMKYETTRSKIANASATVWTLTKLWRNKQNMYASYKNNLNLAFSLVGVAKSTKNLINFVQNAPMYYMY